jgi:hypothetical protein
MCCFCYVDICYFRLDFPLLAVVPLMKRETDGATDVEGIGDNVCTAADPAASPLIGVDVCPDRGAEAARTSEALVAAARFGNREVDSRWAS